MSTGYAADSPAPTAGPAEPVALSHAERQALCLRWAGLPRQQARRFARKIPLCDVDELAEEGKTLPPFERQVADTWRELETLASKPDAAG